MGNKVQLQPVVMNLLLNAYDAMKDLHPSQRNASLKIERDGDQALKIIVRDVGYGFPENGVERVFQPFYTTKPAGLGIGLSMSARSSKRIAAAFGRKTT